jgi:small subunit ribosomal protein S9
VSEEENTEDVTPEETPEAAAEETPAAEAVVEETPEVAATEEAAEGEVEGAEAAGEVEVEEAATEAAEEVVTSQEQKPKSNLPPGADLEPLVEPEPEVELSAEELAAREAEEEERAAREAADSDEDAPVAKPAPITLAKDARFIATGKRKRSVARVIVLPGDGTITINDREIDEYFPRARHRTVVNSPLVATGYESNVNIKIRVHGGGISGQAGAVRHGIARALTEVDPELRPELKRRGFLTRDARAKERRKAGFKKARKRPQFSKR